MDERHRPDLFAGHYHRACPVSSGRMISSHREPTASGGAREALRRGRLLLCVLVRRPAPPRGSAPSVRESARARPSVLHLLGEPELDPSLGRSDSDRIAGPVPQSRGRHRVHRAPLAISPRSPVPADRRSPALLVYPPSTCQIRMRRPTLENMAPTRSTGRSSFLAYVQGVDDVHPDTFGFDGAVEFPPLARVAGLLPREITAELNSVSPDVRPGSTTGATSPPTA